MEGWRTGSRTRTMRKFPTRTLSLQFKCQLWTHVSQSAFWQL